MLHHHHARRALRGAAALTCAATLAAACSGDTEAAEPPSGAPDQVTYLTAFGSFGRDAFAWCGVERGVFADHNIEVTIEPGNGTDANLEILYGGQAEFVLVDLAGGVLARGVGVEGWKAFAAIHQTDLSTWMTDDPDLQAAQDLEGRKVAMPFSGVIPAIFPTYADLAGADFDQIEIVTAAPPQIPGMLASGQVDAIAQFAVGQPFVQSAVGGEVYVHPLSEHLTDLYGVGVATTDETIADDPGLVERFRDALLESLDWAMTHPDECVEIYAERVPEGQPAPVALAEMQLMDAYVRSGTTFGTLDQVRVAQMIATLEGSGAIPAGITPQDIVDFEIAAEEATQ